MNDLLKLKPYTVTEYRDEHGNLVMSICEEGKLLVHTDYIDPDSMACLLNDAYTKGIEAERARQLTLSPDDLNILTRCISNAMGEYPDDHPCYRTAFKAREVVAKLTVDSRASFAALTPDSGMTPELRAAIEPGKMSFNPPSCMEPDSMSDEARAKMRKNPA